MFNFPPKVCELLCAGKAEWNLENLNFFLLLLLISVKRPKGAVLMMRSYAIVLSFKHCVVKLHQLLK